MMMPMIMMVGRAKKKHDDAHDDAHDHDAGLQNKRTQKPPMSQANHTRPATVRRVRISHDSTTGWQNIVQLQR